MTVLAPPSTSAPPTPKRRSDSNPGGLRDPPKHPPLSLCVGIITSAPPTALRLLLDLEALATSERLARITAVILDNTGGGNALATAIESTKFLHLERMIISPAQQRLDARRGAFGRTFPPLSAGPAGIASARTMLQRYLSDVMSMDPGAVGWLLDDDMRLDGRALWYLSWLPAFRDQGVDVLLGSIEGASPNPPLHGLQGQLFDLVHNLTWLRGLPSSTLLPNRAIENEIQRLRFPDYYYDLSRRHTDHLSAPLWLEPATVDETVAAAHQRLLESARHLLAGAPVTRDLRTPLPSTPLAAAVASVNRGGNTFVFQPQALRDTPNLTLRAGALEARRSDMFWAIANRYYRGRKIKAVAFPVIHVGRTVQPGVDLEKIAAELIGSAIYAALNDFLGAAPGHRLDFSPEETSRIGELTCSHRDRRLAALANSFARIAELREQLRLLARPAELSELMADLDTWITPRTLERVRAMAHEPRASEFESFVSSMRSTSDDYACATPLRTQAQVMRYAPRSKP